MKTFPRRKNTPTLRWSRRRSATETCEFLPSSHPAVQPSSAAAKSQQRPQTPAPDAMTSSKPWRHQNTNTPRRRLQPFRRSIRIAFSNTRVSYSSRGTKSPRRKYGRRDGDFPLWFYKIPSWTVAIVALIVMSRNDMNDDTAMSTVVRKIETNKHIGCFVDTIGFILFLRST